jgi:hypothetical protein
MQNTEYDLVATTKERVMRTTYLFVLVTTFISAWLLPSCATTGPTPTAAEPARITVLYDAFGKDATMGGERVSQLHQAREIASHFTP